MRSRSKPTQITTITVDGREVDVVFKAIKNINLSVRPPDGRVRVSAPHHVSLSRITALIRERADWIQKHQTTLTYRQTPAPLVYQTGDRIMLWGGEQRLVIRDGKRGRATWTGTHIVLTCPEQATRDQRERILDRLYRRCLEEAIPPLLARWEPVIGHTVSKVAYQRMKTRWGTCQPVTGVVRFNTELAKYHPSCLEYVVVHELVHFLEPNHNQRFKGFMDKWLPDWRTRKELLNASAKTDQLFR